MQKSSCNNIFSHLSQFISIQKRNAFRFRRREAERFAVCSCLFLALRTRKISINVDYTILGKRSQLSIFLLHIVVLLNGLSRLGNRTS